jgi:septum formation protein
MSGPIVLASTSRYRHELLSRLRVPFEVASPGVNESVWQQQGFSPSELAVRLAAAKARAVAEKRSDATVIGSDQVASIDGEILNKPGTRERAVEQLGRLAGRTHQLWTAVTMIAGDRQWDWLDETRLTMARLTREELIRYVEADDPIDCAGAYKIESIGIGLFERVETEDPTAIVGLPLTFVSRCLREMGWRIP